MPLPNLIASQQESTRGLMPQRQSILNQMLPQILSSFLSKGKSDETSSLKPLEWEREDKKTELKRKLDQEEKDQTAAKASVLRTLTYLDSVSDNPTRYSAFYNSIMQHPGFMSAVKVSNIPQYEIDRRNPELVLPSKEEAQAVEEKKQLTKREETLNALQIKADPQIQELEANIAKGAYDAGAELRTLQTVETQKEEERLRNVEKQQQQEIAETSFMSDFTLFQNAMVDGKGNTKTGEDYIDAVKNFTAPRITSMFESYLKGASSPELQKQRKLEYAAFNMLINNPKMSSKDRETNLAFLKSGKGNPLGGVSPFYLFLPSLKTAQWKKAMLNIFSPKSVKDATFNMFTPF